MRKKLLILGGAPLHCGVVETAKEMGIETYVTDNIPAEYSPAKQIADHDWDFDIYEYSKIADRCREEGIDGVLMAHLNPCQLPYQKICEMLGLPCFATADQYKIFTNKKLFLDACTENGVDIIEQYREADFLIDNPNIKYPLYVKPSDSRGSRGQAICRSYAEMSKAIMIAKEESSNDEVIIERYMEGCQDIQLTYFVMDGEPYLYCIGDKHNGTEEEGHQGSVIAGITPSFNTKAILNDANKKISKMLKNLKLKNTPVFIQGFLDGDKLRVYDPALRLPGFLYERNLRKATGFDTYRSMINFALTGRFLPELKNVEATRDMSGKLSVSIWIFIREGTITEIRGVEELRKNPAVVRIDERYRVGSVIEDWRDVRNSYCEIAFICEDVNEAKAMIRLIYETVRIFDEHGQDMKIAIFNPDKIDGVA